MSENKRSHRHHGESDPSGDHGRRPPYWARVHRDWKFWVALSLMLAAMVVYVMSDDLAIRPHRQIQQRLSGAAGR
jgi:hypothetical protein